MTIIHESNRCPASNHGETNMTKVIRPSVESVTRRAALGRGLAGGAAAALGTTLLGRQALAAPVPDPTVQTTAGQVKGKLIRRVCVFKGVPYAASTERAGRFMPPAKLKPWTGVREALKLAVQAPQAADPTAGMNPEVKALVEGIFEPAPLAIGEDCLALNVFTPAVGDGKKRPVFVWCHGGGFASGSGGAPWYDGSNLVRKNDVVVVTINHRLSIFGYLYLGDANPKFADSGNAGMLDIVSALQWVKDNIAGFGGDPGNVTIAGESGGGSKVSVLMAMPAARGLFHKAIIQSGSALRAIPKEDAAKTADAVLAQVGLTHNQVDQLQMLPKGKLLEARAAVQKAGHQFGPVVDGKALPGHPWDPKAPAISVDVPVMIGCTKDESRLFAGGDAKTFALDDAGLAQRVKAALSLDDPKTAALIDVYKKSHPGASPSDVYFAVTSDRTRLDAITQAERKVALKRQTGVYMYIFAWEAPAFGGKYKAAHATDVPYTFDNVDAAPGAGGSMPDRRKLSDRASRGFMTFCFTGSPSYQGLGMPKWPAYTPETRSTMIFDNECKVVDDPGKEDRLALAKVVKL